jgi:hypothetical protein
MNLETRLDLKAIELKAIAKIISELDNKLKEIQNARA